MKEAAALRRALKALQCLGFEPGLDESALRREQRFAGSDEERLAAIHRVARSGGANSQRTYLNEHNLLGSGMSLGLSHSANVERAGNEVSFANRHLFGTHAALSASYANLTDGTQWSFGLARPFYALDTRYAAGMSASYSDAVNKVYEQGVVTSQYRALTRNWEAFGGWSAGRVNG